MEGVLEKFSIYDFFNLLFSGGILIAGFIYWDFHY